MRGESLNAFVAERRWRLNGVPSVLFRWCTCFLHVVVFPPAKATGKQVLVNRCSRTRVSSISSLVERILAGTEHTSFFLCFAPPPLADSWERRRRDIECFCCTVSHGFFMNFYITRPLYFSTPSLLGSLICRCGNLCVQCCYGAIGHRIPCRVSLLGFCSQYVGVLRKTKQKKRTWKLVSTDRKSVV